MVGAGLLDRFRLGALGESRIGSRAARLSRSFSAAASAFERRASLGFEVDHAFQRQGKGRAPDDDLRRARRRRTADSWIDSSRASRDSIAVLSIEARRQLVGRIGREQVQLGATAARSARFARSGFR